MSDRIAAQNKMSNKCPSDFDPKIKFQKNVRRAPASSKKVRKRSGGLRCPPKRSGKGQSSPHPGNDWFLLRSIVLVSQVKHCQVDCSKHKNFIMLCICIGVYDHSAYTQPSIGQIPKGDGVPVLETAQPTPVVPRGLLD